MKTTAEINTRLTLGPDVAAQLTDYLEVALDCAHCRRTQRTTSFAGQEPGICHSVRHLTAARVQTATLEQRGAEVGIQHVVEYDFEPFTDAKYGQPATGVPAWTRVYFTVTCPTCRAQTESSTQTNLVRPRTKTCACGQMLFQDTQPPDITAAPSG